MEITNLRWLERMPTWPRLAEESLNYRLQLLVANGSVFATATRLRQLSASASIHPLRFDVPGSFNGRLFDCRLTVAISEINEPQWKGKFEQQLRALCRETRTLRRH